jgi:hypothetical protein
VTLSSSILRFLCCTQCMSFSVVGSTLLVQDFRVLGPGVYVCMYVHRNGISICY